MRINKKYTTDTELVLTVTADEDFLTKVKNRTLKKLAREVKVPGFRPGMAPEALVEKQLSPEALQTEFLEGAVNRLYSDAVNAEKIRPVANPQVAVKKFVPYSTLEFEATVEVIGEMQLADYKKIKVAREAVVVTDEDVDGVIKSLQKRLATRESVERAAKNDDEVVIDFAGTDKDGKPVAGADAKEYPIILGSNSFIPGFEDEVVGLKPGAEKTFDIKFPKSYQVKDLASQVVTFKVNVRTVTELKDPAVDDDFAAKSGPFKTVKELREDIKKQLTYEQGVEAQKAYENELIKAISAKSKVALPASLIDDQVKRAEDDERRNLVYRGQTWEEHLKEDGVSEKEHRLRNRPAAEETIKASLVLSEIADLEGVRVTTDEVDVRITILKGQYQDKAMRAELDKPENRRDIEARLMAEKTFELLATFA